MMPHLRTRRPNCGTLFALLLATMSCLAGCRRDSLRDDGPELSQFIDETTGVQLIGDIARPWGLNYMKVEAVALVTGLPDTGSDPAPSAQRDALLNEMQVRKVEKPNAILASPKTALVLLKGYIPPAAKKGDTFDVLAQSPSRSNTKNLRGGWVLPARMKMLAVLGGRVRSGRELALARGPLLADSVFQGDRLEAHRKRGRLLGGGVVLKSRSLGLALNGGQYSARTSTLISNAVNRRFHIKENGVKRGVATPKRDNYIDLKVLPQYRYNLLRYVNVVRSIPLRETPSQEARRLLELERDLLEPAKSARAALRLEALGPSGVEPLRKGLAAKEAEVRFHAAEALAYLDQPEAAAELGKIAEAERAFRHRALTALGALRQAEAYDALLGLLHGTSAETRYGAFQTLRRHYPGDALISGEMLGNQFRLHHVPSAGEPLVHISKMNAPEIVLFGDDIRLATPVSVLVGANITLKSQDDGRMRLVRFRAGEDDQRRVVTNRLEEIIRAAADLGADYDQVADMLQKVKADGSLTARVVVGATPELGRTYNRDDAGFDSGEDDLGGDEPETDGEPATAGENSSPAEADGRSTKRSWWSRMFIWWG